MLILDDRVNKTAKVMESMEKDTNNQKLLHMQNARLSKLIREMSKMSASVKRSGDVKKIARFNKQFFAATRDLTLIRGQIGRSTRDDVVDIIKQWKEKK
jgi:hypothetical protein